MRAVNTREGSLTRRACRQYIAGDSCGPPLAGMRVLFVIRSFPIQRNFRDPAVSVRITDPPEIPGAPFCLQVQVG
jgi:hypothetical protein